MKRYIFPAIFHAEDGEWWVEFPDLPGCFTQAQTIEDAMAQAEEALSLHIYGMVKDGDSIAEATNPSSLSTVESADFVSLIEARYLEAISDKDANRAVKKTLTIPQWLNEAAEKKHINFSHVLQEELKKRVGYPEALIGQK